MKVYKTIFFFSVPSRGVPLQFPTVYEPTLPLLHYSVAHFNLIIDPLHATVEKLTVAAQEMDAWVALKLVTVTLLGISVCICGGGKVCGRGECGCVGMWVCGQ